MSVSIVPTLRVLKPTAMIAGVGFIALVFGYRRYLTASSERRMGKMLEAVGVDPRLASSPDADLIMAELRGRCTQCQSEDVCERWLRGEESGGNDFCPNHKIFELLMHIRGARS